MYSYKHKLSVFINTVTPSSYERFIFSKISQSRHTQQVGSQFT